MADVGGGDAAVAEELLFEGEDAQELCQGAAHRVHAILSPRPGLGGDELHYGDAEFPEAFRDAEVEAGGVSEDGEVGFLVRRGAGKFVEDAEDARDVGDDGEQTDDGELALVHDGSDAGGLHAGAGDAEEFGFGMAGF